LVRFNISSPIFQLNIFTIATSALLVSGEVAKPILFDQALLEKFQQVTVKVENTNNWGSGVIIKRQGNFYWVITNRHVIEPSKNFCIDTYDGQAYVAKAINPIEFTGIDLGLLVFYSSKNSYPIQILPSSSLNIIPKIPVVATGYPYLFQANKPVGYVSKVGEVELILTTPMEDGYSIAYSSEVVKGMSGGGIFNQQGDLLGINGIHAYPLWQEDYKYENGKNLSPELNQKLQALSIGIPSSLIAQRLNKFKFVFPKMPTKYSCKSK